MYAKRLVNMVERIRCDSTVVLLMVVLLTTGLVVEINAMCNTAVLNSCVATFTNTSYPYTQGNLFDKSTFNAICRILNDEATCVSNAGCTSADVDNGDNTNNNAGNINGYQYLCNLSSSLQQTFVNSFSCFYGPARSDAFQACYNDTIGQAGSYITDYCRIQNDLNSCQFNALEDLCSTDFASIYVTWTVRMVQIQLSSVGCTLVIPTTKPAVTIASTANIASTTNTSTQSLIIGVVVGVGGSLLIVLIVAGTVLYLRRRKQQSVETKVDSNKQDIEFSDGETYDVIADEDVTDGTVDDGYTHCKNTGSNYGNKYDGLRLETQTSQIFQSSVDNNDIDVVRKPANVEPDEKENLDLNKSPYLDDNGYLKMTTPDSPDDVGQYLESVVEKEKDFSEPPYLDNAGYLTLSAAGDYDPQSPSATDL